MCELGFTVIFHCSVKAKVKTTEELCMSLPCLASARIELNIFSEIFTSFTSDDFQEDLRTA